MVEELVASNRQRAECYRLLAASFCLPGKEFIEEDLSGNLAAALAPVCPEAVAHAKGMAESITKYDMRTGILVDYSALFIGPFKLLAPPYGSVYMEEGRTLMGDSTVDAVKTYLKAGVEMDDQHKDMPDHISVELEFMYYLITREIEAEAGQDTEGVERYRKAQKDFLSRHIGAWVFKFAEDMKNNAKTSFYTSLADCTTVFLQAEMNAGKTE
jgi:DMSO reductase family type II enzyme chaperone